MNPSNILVRQKLKNAMLQLLEQKHISQISITELIELAHVGRVSFYRNYEIKESIVVEALGDKLADWAKELKRSNSPISEKDMQNALLILQPTMRVLYKSGSEYIIYLFIKEFNNIFQLFPTDESPKRTIRAGIYFGMIDYWASNNFKETVEDLTVLFKDHLHAFSDPNRK